MGTRRLLRLAGRLAALAALLFVGEIAFYAAAALTLPPPASAPPRPTQLRGVYHVHSRLSDGRGTPDEIAAAAARAGLSFVVLADHNLMEIPPPRFSNGVLLIFATELSTPQGHVIAVDLARGLSPAEREGDVIAEIHRQEGAAFISHPVQRKAPWRDWEAAARAEGMELYSGDSLFREALERPFGVLLPALGTFVPRPAWGLWMLARESVPTRERFLGMSREKRASALCANDSHGWPGYESSFRALSLYLETPEPLSTNPSVAGKQVTRALRQGAFHCGFGDWASADGFAFRGELDGDRRAPVGSVLDLVLPPAPPGLVRVHVFGAGKWDAAAQRVVLQAPGPVWVEVWVQPEGGLSVQDWRPWIVSSPIRVVPR